MARVLVVLLLLLPAAADDPFDPADVAEPATVAEWILARNDARRRESLAQEGGSAQTEYAVRIALQWLAAHQDDDGRWDADGFMKHDPEDDRSGGPGGPPYDVGVTGLALLAFLGHGHGYRGDDVHAPVVAKGLRFLLGAQAKDGRIAGAGRASIYEHAIATAALCEAYGTLQHPQLATAAQRALVPLALVREPGRGWRYAAGSGECDTSVTAWCALALHTGRLSGLVVDEDAFAGARAWVELMTDRRTGRTGYNTVGGPSWWHPETGERPAPWTWPEGAERYEAMTAAAFCVRLFAGDDPGRDKPMKAAAKLCAAALPRWDEASGDLDPHAWFWCATALHRTGGSAWKKWNTALTKALLLHQHPKGAGSRTGSWDPVGPWARECGRAGTTALLALTLESYYRLP